MSFSVTPARISPSCANSTTACAPTASHTHYYFAHQLLEVQKRFPEAIQHYERALQCKPPPALREKSESALRRLK
jgi:tetratricopeptide (TPR) repeat protein